MGVQRREGVEESMAKVALVGLAASIPRLLTGLKRLDAVPLKGPVGDDAGGVTFPNRAVELIPVKRRVRASSSLEMMGEACGSSTCPRAEGAFDVCGTVSRRIHVLRASRSAYGDGTVHGEPNLL